MNLYASQMGWLRKGCKGRWWCLVWNKNLLIYTDANTTNPPSLCLRLTEETKVKIKSSNLLLIKSSLGDKFKFKVESGNINKWKTKLEEEIEKTKLKEEIEKLILKPSALSAPDS